MNDDSRQAAYAAWQQARQDIFAEWSFATDPINLQPKVRPVLKRAADVVRKFPPPDMDRDSIDKMANSLEAPWGARTENRIREALEDGSGAGVAAKIITAVKELGLTPYEAPEPLPPIQIEEVSLICWMAVRGEPKPSFDLPSIP